MPSRPMVAEHHRSATIRHRFRVRNHPMEHYSRFSPLPKVAKQRSDRSIVNRRCAGGIENLRTFGSLARFSHMQRAKPPVQYRVILHQISDDVDIAFAARGRQRLAIQANNSKAVCFGSSLQPSVSQSLVMTRSHTEHA
jgi:hypothetical protein